ncbi:MAG: phytanoyl-CoA dioxygenase family protein [Novosphingobium sp.]
MATAAMGYGSQADAMDRYFREGEARALALGNRGPLRLGADGRLAPDIVEAYEGIGFYVFEGVIAPEELAELETNYRELFERLPSAPDSEVDRLGRPAAGRECELGLVHWAKPLSDPLGGTSAGQGRHPLKMFEPDVPEGAPEWSISSILAPLYHCEAMLRLYGHPALLAAAATILGDDFTPFQEGIIVKLPGEGRIFPWHQDGTTHWGRPGWHMHSHGFNFMPQLYGSTAANGVWVVPGTHKTGKADIRALADRAGSERLDNAAPLICKPGDVVMTNRQALHGSFANTSADIRVTLNFGFLPRESVLGAGGRMHDGETAAKFDETWVARRAESIGYAIAARRQRWPDEQHFAYAPHVAAGAAYVWDAAARDVLRDYNRWDIRI